MTKVTLFGYPEPNPSTDSYFDCHYWVCGYCDYGEHTAEDPQSGARPSSCPHCGSPMVFLETHWHRYPPGRHAGVM